MFIQQCEVGTHTSTCGVFDSLSLFLPVDCVLCLFVFVWPTAYLVFCKTSISKVVKKLNILMCSIKKILIFNYLQDIPGFWFHVKQIFKAFSKRLRNELHAFLFLNFKVSESCWVLTMGSHFSRTSLFSLDPCLNHNRVLNPLLNSQAIIL